MFSFTKASGAVLLAFVSLAQATITITSHDLKVNSTDSSTINWTSSDADTDPESFSIELVNKIFNSQFALGNNVATSAGTISFSMPVVLAGDGYTIEFVNPGNINSIISQTGSFSIEGTDSFSTTSGASTSTSASSTTSASTGTSRTGTATATGVSTSSGASTVVQSSSGSAASSTAPASSSGAGTSGLSTGTSASSSPSASPSNNSAAGLVPAGSLAALIAAAVALL